MNGELIHWTCGSGWWQRGGGTVLSFGGQDIMVSVASVVKWSQRQRALGSPAALKMGGHRPYLVARERDWVLSRIAEKPDLTLRALLKERPTAALWSATRPFAFSSA